MTVDLTVDLDRLKSAFDKSVEYALPNVDYFALYTCQVISQNADGTLDVKPQRADWPTQKNIPFRCGIPGVKMTVNAGAQVLLAWANGDPSMPFCALWLTGAEGDLLNLTIAMSGNLTLNVDGNVKLGTTATHGVGRVGDQVEVTIPLGAVIVAAEGGTPNPAPITLTGTITAGSKTVTAAS